MADSIPKINSARLRRLRWKKHHAALLIVTILAGAAWICSAFFVLKFQLPKVGSVVFGGGAVTIWTMQQTTLQQQSQSYFVREDPWKIEWAWPIDRGHFVDSSMQEFRDGESLGWHPPRKPEFFLRPWLVRSTASWFVRAPLWMVVVPLGLLVAAMRIRHIRSPYVPTCERCGYCLSGITPDANAHVTCPECGAEQAV